MSAGLSTIGTILKAGATSGALKAVGKIKSYPQLGGEPNANETTDLEDVMQTFVPGVQQMEAMTYTMNYDKTTYEALKKEEGKEQVYELNFGSEGKDGQFSWKGSHTVYVNGGEVNGIREMTLSVMPSTVIQAQAAATAFP